MTAIYVAISPALAGEIQLESQLARLDSSVSIERWQGPGGPSLAVVVDAIRRCDILITGWGTPSLTEALRGWSPQTSALRLIAHTAGSIKFLVPPEALQAGLQIVHANDSLAEAVAEFTLGTMLACRRQMFLGAARLRAGERAPVFTSMHELPGSTIGIIGASAIGRRVMDLLRPWHVNLLLSDPYASVETAAAYQARLVDLPTLMRESDIVSLHAPVTAETLGMLRAEHFAAMKDGALFINTARGKLLDASALLAELQRGRIWAALDVTDPEEPLPPSSLFFQLENCVVFPHIAGNSVEARARQGKMVVDDILAYLGGNPLHYRVDVRRWDQIA